jgi:lipopolysaccharide export LptBFGC system permease protein LptF
MLKGLAVSFGVMLLLLGALYLTTGLETLDSWLLPIAGLPFPLIGLALGRAATRIKAKRFRKLFGIGLGLVYLTALAFAGAMVLADGSGLIPLSEAPQSILWLGTVGFVLYAALTVPVLLLGVFVIERWTRAPL